MIIALIVSSAILSWQPEARAWENHPTITRASLQSYEGWEPAVFEPIDKVLSSLSVNGAAAPKTLSEFADQLVIRKDFIKWDWQPQEVGGTPPTLLEVVVKASLEPDDGMDQNLNIDSDQKYMGGFEGPSSQGIRHMFYRGWTPLQPLLTFHFPLNEMGFAPSRAELYFNLAQQAAKGGHLFWAHRFLGWGLHYVQDIGQPYHANQFGSFKLLPLRVLMSVGWGAFVAESTRLVGNFHLSFEQYVNFLSNVDRDSPLLLAFKVPKADESLKIVLEQKTELGVADGVKRLAVASAEMAESVVDAQYALMGEVLMASSMNLIPGFKDSNGNPKINFAPYEANPELKKQRKAMFNTMERALSNTGVATRWYVDRFRTLTAEMTK